VTQQDANTETYILFELSETTYGVSSRSVQQMEMIEHITPLPNAPSFVEGVVFTRGQVIPAVNLRTRFGFAKVAFTARTRLIVTNHNGRVVGLIVDSAREFLAIPKDKIQPPPESVAGLSGKYLQGIVTLDDRIVLVVDLDELVSIGRSKAASLDA
jgi:purine-binding chemotaxis protein CheW